MPEGPEKGATDTVVSVPLCGAGMPGMLHGTGPWVQGPPLVLSQGKGGDGFCLRRSEVVEVPMGRS